MAAWSPKAIVQPQVLRWLRDSSGLTIEETAGKLGTKPKNLVAWEDGQARPSMPQLRKLAKAFRRPISYFFLPAPVQEPPVPHDFRRFPGVDARPYSAALRHEIRMAHRRRALALDLVADLGVRSAALDFYGTVSLGDDREELAHRVRRRIGVEFGDQRTWREPRKAFGMWRRKIESLGVLVFQTATVDLQEMLGFSLAYPELPVIAVNRKNSVNGRTFTMLHEFAHLLLGESGVCDIDEQYPRNSKEQEVEVFCNHVAGAALVPKAALLAHSMVAPVAPVAPVGQEERSWEDAEIASLARDFGTSEEVIVRRLLVCNRASQEFYAQKRAQYGSRRASRPEARRSGQDFKRNIAQEKASDFGAFARLVLDAYYADVLTLSDASRHLGIRARKVAAVNELLR